MHTAANIVLAVALAAVLAGGIALATIARQDDSPTGQRIGLASAVVAIAALAWLFAGRHWL